MQQEWSERDNDLVDCIASEYDNLISKNKNLMSRMKSWFHFSRSTINIRHARVSDQRRFLDIY